MKARDRLQNTVVLLSADHGESFEHDYFTHGEPHLYEAVTHIPLIIKDAGQTMGRRIDTYVEQIDIPATILDLSGTDIPSWTEGRSLVPIMLGEELPSQPIYSMCFANNKGLGHRLTKGTVAVWENDLKLIYYIEEKKALLFDLGKDSDEKNNLIEKEHETGQRLLNMILLNLEKANEKMISEESIDIDDLM